MSEAWLRNADLRNANLQEAKLNDSIFEGAKLNGIDLSHANLDGAVLTRAILTEAKLFSTKFSSTSLDGADLSRAIMVGCIFAGVDLSKVKGLETIEHRGRSTIGVDTIILSQGQIPAIFLQNVGIPESIVEFIPSLIGSLNPIDFYSCFISYSKQDEILAQRLHSDLQTKGVHCWFAPHDIHIGDKIRQRIDEAIHLQDKLLLILSQSALESEWIETEVEVALDKERRQNREVLFPVRIDDSIIHPTQAWARHLLLKRHIGDFTRWTDPLAYNTAFERLLRDLKKADSE